ncbi:hypothetical protein HGRIS_001059 [Hohenbuehelia grisea]|uniref:Uncharacterized protein n=1 Tax=Hohenbuehelia grisea TaxID=104357 RepID=A0ABR3JN48_9AGAR
MLSVPVSFRRRFPRLSGQYEEKCLRRSEYLIRVSPFVGQAAQVEKVDVSGSTEAARVLPWLESGSVDEEVGRGRSGEIFIRNQLKRLGWLGRLLARQRAR